MTKYIFLLISCALLLLHSCDEDSFSQIVKIDVPEHEPKPALKLLINAGQDALVALISNSKGIVDPDSVYKIPTDAEVNLYKNGTLLTQLQYEAISLKYVSTLNDPISNTPGDEYILEAKIPGYELVSATQVMPPKPIITNAIYEIDGTIDSDGYRVDEVIVDVSDADPDQINYYGMSVFELYHQLDTNGDTIETYKNEMYLDTNDPLLSYGDRYGLIFTDAAFSGGTFKARAYTYNSVDEGVDIEVEVYQLTKDAFFFERSLDQYDQAIDNPFAEPVTVHNNIEGGFGIFSLANSTIFKIR